MHIIIILHLALHNTHDAAAAASKAAARLMVNYINSSKTLDNVSFDSSQSVGRTDARVKMWN
jgi:hypothetical protein